MQADRRGVDFLCGMHNSKADNADLSCAYVFHDAAANWDIIPAQGHHLASPETAEQHQENPQT